MRQIQPHKGDNSGGRTERFNGRCTPRIKQMADEVKKETGLSDADIYHEAILDWHRYLFGSGKDTQKPCTLVP